MTYGLAKGRQNPVSKCQYISRWRPLLCLFIGRAIVGVTISLGELGITAVGSAGRSVGNNATAFVVNGPLLTSSAKANKCNAQIPKKTFFFVLFFCYYCLSSRYIPTGRIFTDIHHLCDTKI